MLGFYIKELRVTGLGVKDASIKFEKGLNVINGPSNTGKSYVFNCIDYMFGASKLKTFKLSDPYDNVFLEIRDFEFDKPTTIFRSISNSNMIFFSNSNIDGFKINKQNKLASDHDANNENNISRFLLNRIGLEENKYLMTNQNGKKKSLSFRGIANLTLVSETKIISDEESPIFNKVKTDETYCKSLLRYLLTKVDDVDCEEIEKTEIRKARLESKIEYIYEEIDLLNNELESLIFRSEDLKSSNAIMNIDSYNEEITNIENNINSKRELITQNRNEQNELNNQKSRLTLLLNKFEILKVQYESDLQRLEFIQDGEAMLGEVNINCCPICNNTIEDHSQIDITDIYEATNHEARKITSHINELSTTISDTSFQAINIDQQINELQAAIERGKSELEGISSSKLIPLKRLMEIYLEYAETEGKIEDIKSRISSKHFDLEDFKQKLIQKQDKLNYNTSISQTILSELTENIKKTLVSWGFDEEKNIEVTFDEKEQDITINGQPRKSNGKGFRAFFYAAFSVSLVDLLITEGSPISRVLVLDSPVTTLKENEIKTGKINEGDFVEESMQNSMFKSLSKHSEGKQIIIIENKELPEGITNCNHIAFTKGEREGRYGFFPIDEQ